MVSLLNSLIRRRSGGVEKRYTVNDYAQWLSEYGGGLLMSGASTHSNEESIESSFVGFVQGAYKRNGIVFGCMLARMLLFSEARFAFQRIRDGRPDELHGGGSGSALRPLERPWPNGSTGDLLTRMIQDADLAGNFFAAREADRLRRLRPDWVKIILSAPPAEAVESDVIGYAYYPGGVHGGMEPRLYTVEEVVHWAPIPDPEAQYRGMSWLTPTIRDIEADEAATEHKLSFFRNGAALATVLTLPDTLTEEQHKKWVRKFRNAHQGTRNAYEPLFLGGGADVKAIGTNLQELDMKIVQGAGETRIALDSGIHPVILGLSEGLAGSSLNAGNFQAARRLTADKALRPNWRSAAGALEQVVQVPDDSRLWYDDRDIPFLREDAKDLAEIQATEAQSIRTLFDAAFEPDSVVAAVVAQNWKLLKHTGLPPVQAQNVENVKDAKDGTTGSDPEGGDAPADGSTGSASAKPAAVQKQRDVAETIQKVYLGVGKVITADEARAIANKAGADLVLPGPFQESDTPEPTPEPPAVPEPQDDPIEEQEQDS